MPDKRFDITFCSKEFVESKNFDTEKQILTKASMKNHLYSFHDLIEGHANIHDNLLTVMRHDAYETLDDDDKTMFTIHQEILEKYGFNQDTFDLFYQMNVAYFREGYHPEKSLKSFVSSLRNMNAGIDQCCKEFSIRNKESSKYPSNVPDDLKKRIRAYKRSMLIYRYGFNKVFENH